MKKIISFLLAFVLVFQILNPVYAEEHLFDSTLSDSEVKLEADTHVSPTVEEVLGLQISPLALDNDVAPEVPDINKIPHFNSLKEGAEYARSQQKRRAAEFAFAIYMPGNYSGDFWDDFNEIIYTHTGIPDEGDYLDRSVVYRTNGWAWSYYDRSINRTVYIVLYTPEYFSDLTQENETRRAINRVLVLLNLNGKNNYEKIKAVYDWICSNVTYDHEHLEMEDDYLLQYTAYAAIINRTSVCQGYASLFYRMMLTLGIDSRYISGFGNGGNHGWNIVKLGNVYYNVDATWDSERVGNYKYFLTSPASFTDHTRREQYDTYEFHAKYPMAGYNFSFAGHAHVYGWSANTSMHWKECTICAQRWAQDIYVGGYGDVNGDEYIDASDALQILKIAARLESSAEDQLVVGDVDGNGQLEAGDALLVLKRAALLTDRFPVEAVSQF